MYSERRPVFGGFTLETWDIFEIIICEAEMDRDAETLLSRESNKRLSELHL